MCPWRCKFQQVIKAVRRNILDDSSYSVAVEVIIVESIVDRKWIVGRDFVHVVGSGRDFWIVFEHIC